MSQLSKREEDMTNSSLHAKKECDQKMHKNAKQEEYECSQI